MGVPGVAVQIDRVSSVVANRIELQAWRRVAQDANSVLQVVVDVTHLHDRGGRCCTLLDHDAVPVIPRFALARARHSRRGSADDVDAGLLVAVGETAIDVDGSVVETDPGACGVTERAVAHDRLRGGVAEEGLPAAAPGLATLLENAVGELGGYRGA